jgi:hypothetical protein
MCEEWSGPPQEILSRIEEAENCRALLRVWNDLRDGSDRPPRKSAIDPLRLASAGLLPFVCIVEREAEGRFFYRLTGEMIRTHSSLPMKGRYLEEVFDGDVLTCMLSRFERILADPHIEFSAGTVYRGSRPVYYARRLILPLCDESGARRFLIGAIEQERFDTVTDAAVSLRHTYDFIGTLPLSAV